MAEGPPKETRIILGEDQNLYWFEADVPKVTDQQPLAQESETKPAAAKAHQSDALLRHAALISMGAEHSPSTTDK